MGEGESASESGVSGAAYNDLEAGDWQYIFDGGWPQSPVGLGWTNVTGVAVDKRRNEIYVLQRGEPSVSIWRPDGTPLRQWKDGLFSLPHAIKVFDENTSHEEVWVADMGDGVAPRAAPAHAPGHCLTCFSPDSQHLRTIGTCGAAGSGLDPVQFDRVTDLARDSQGHLFVTDGDRGGKNNRVLKLTGEGKVLDVWNPGNKPGSGPKQFNLPHAVAVDVLDRVWVADAVNARLQVIAADGSYLGELKFPGSELVFGIAFSAVRPGPGANSTGMAFVLTVPADGKGVGQAWIIPVVFDRNEPKRLPDVRALQRWAPRLPSKLTGSATAHLLAVDGGTDRLYLALLGKLPPQEYRKATPRPVIKPSSAKTSPPLPEKFHAVALMHPFWLGDQVAVAEIWYDWSLRAMRVLLLGTMGGFCDLLITEEGTFELAYDGPDPVIGRPSRAVGPFDAERWKLPAPDWLDPHAASCRGLHSVMGVDTSWWRALASAPGPTAQVDWFWFRAGDGSPFRMMFHAWDSPWRLPVIGDYSMSYFPTFERLASVPEPLKEALALPRRPTPSPFPQATGFPAASAYLQAKSGIPPSENTPERVWARIAGLIPGLTPYDPRTKLPHWPPHLYLTAIMTPVSSDDPMPTEVLYDWDVKKQRTRMFKVGGGAQDAILLPDRTYLVQRDASGVVTGCQRITSFGPPNSKWPTTSQCRVMAVIKDNPHLSPGRTTMILQCPMVPPRVLWTWYTTESLPVVFFETSPPPQVGTSLALADYCSYEADPVVDLRAFEPPPQCPDDSAVAAARPGVVALALSSRRT